MVNRSLIATTYVYVIAVCLLLAGASKFLGDHLVSNDRAAQITHMNTDTAATAGLVGLLAESTWTPGGVPPQTLAAIRNQLHVTLRPQPWPPAPGVMQALRHQKVWRLPSPHIGPEDEDPPHDFWHIHVPPPLFAPPHGRPPGPPPMGGPGGPMHPPDYWVRIDHAATPVSAMYVSFRMDEHRPPPPPTALFALGWGMLLAALIVPPLLIWVIRPLRRMVAIADRLGAGDLETVIPVRRRNEFGHLERAFETMRIRLRHVLAQKERLLTDVSHELRGPLTRIEVAARLMTATGTIEPYVSDIHEDIQQVDGLIGEILLLMRGNSEAPLAIEGTDLAVLATDLLKSRRHVLTERNQTLKTDLASAPMQGDVRLIQRALGNIVDNAIKYTPAGGEVRVTTAVTGDGAICVVADNGPGIGAAHLPHLFEAFYRPDDSRSRETGGTGLGLAITRAIVERHGGRVSLESTPGAGTTVTVTLPVKHKSPRP